MIMVRFMRVLFLLFLTLSTAINISFSDETSNNVLCIESERQALLSFKQDLVDRSNRLSSWAGESDCCKWVGIVCNNETGHVQELRLRRPFADEGAIVATLNAHMSNALGGKINPSLLNLKHLSYLDLSYNEFEGIQIPEFFGSVGSLRYLNLFKAGFEGMIPHQLGNLSSLRYLSLRSLENSYVDNLQWISRLSSLEYLDLSYVSLSKASDWLEMINMLPSLRKLYLANCEFDHIPSLPFVNFTSLSILDVSYNTLSSLPEWVFNHRSLTTLYLNSNNFEGPILSGLQNMTGLRDLDLSENDFNSVPNWFFNLSRLESLDFQANGLQGLIPSALANLTSATRLDFSYNQLEGSIPKSLGNLCHLKGISLMENKISGEVSEVFKSLSGCILDSLVSLQLGGNNLSGQLTDDLIQFRNLSYLSLGGNSISGPIPVSLGSLSSLRQFSIGSNQLSGTLPESLGQLSKLENLDISNNFLEGVVSEVHFANLTNLRTFQASQNPLVLKVNSDWIPPFQLGDLELNSWHLGPQFPLWLQSQTDLGDLDLSCTGISDVIPTWFWNLTSQLTYLNLSHNQIHGKIPYIHTIEYLSFSLVYLGSNQFSGPLPIISSSVTELDLSNNSFSGNMLHFLCDKPDEAKKLRILHLGENLLSGEIPNCWMVWKELKAVKLGNNKLTGTIPSSMGNLSRLQSLHLRNNSLSGEIPEELTSLLGLFSLNLSNNHLTGKIPEKIGDMGLLESLDLSRNQLSGIIPSSMSSMTLLSNLNLSYNNLSGKIPLSTQLQSLNASSFIGNQLCGAPLTENCSADGMTPNVENGKDEGGNGFKVEYGFYLSMVLGFVVGFWGFCGPLLFKRSWRFAYFLFLDHVWNRLWGCFSKFF